MTTTRRKFLQTALGAATLVTLRPSGVRLWAAPGPAVGPARQGRVLIVLQLAGGNDGLNMVVPYADDLYHRARPTLRLGERDVLKIDPSVGLHPQMPELHRLLGAGQASFLQSVGYPNPDRSHGRAMQIWQTAEVKPENSQTGWLGRAADRLVEDQPAAVPAVAVLAAKIHAPSALGARRAIVPRLQQPQDALPHGPAGAAARREPSPAGPPAAGAAQESSLLSFVEETARAAAGIHQRIESVLRERSHQGNRYPASPLAQSLCAVADLVRAELPASIYFVELGGDEPGGFDTHAMQANNHGALLATLSQAVAALVADLQSQRLLDRVLLMTFSEFGRSLEENGRHGTDHGAAAPLLLAGGGLKGGVIGPPPNLADLDGNAPRAVVDFRQLYATLLDGWLGIDSRAVLGGPFPHVDVLKA